MVALCNRADHIYFHPVVCSSSSFFSTHGVALVSANLGCRSETCCTRLTGNAGRKKIAKKSPSAHHHATLLGYIFVTKARIDNRKKNLLSSAISPPDVPTIW